MTSASSLATLSDELDVTLRLGDAEGSLTLGDSGGSKKSAGGELGRGDGDVGMGREGEEGDRGEGDGLSGKDSSARLV